MVRCSLACPHTVASIILIKVIRFLGLSPNCGRVLEDSVSTVETATISFVKRPLRDMENPMSEPRKSMVRIGAITGIVIKLGLYQLCFLAMILLVGVSTFSKSPLIGGETCVQVAFLTLSSIDGKLVKFRTLVETIMPQILVPLSPFRAIDRKLSPHMSWFTQ